MKLPRRVFGSFACAFLALSIASCNSDNTEKSDVGSQGMREVVTEYGEVDVPSVPQRVVALNTGAAANISALGVDPVAVGIIGPSDRENGWVSSDWKIDDNLYANGEVNLELLSQLNPDLIIADTYQVPDREVFEKLNEIAPTVLPASSDVNVGWEDRLMLQAQAVGKENEAVDRVGEIKRKFQNFGSDAGLRSLTYNFVGYGGSSGFGYGNGSILELYGLEPASSQNNTQVNSEIADEKISDLNGDILFIAAGDNKAQAEATPGFGNLPSVRSGRVFFGDDAAIAGAINSPNLLSLDFLFNSLSEFLSHVSE